MMSTNCEVKEYMMVIQCPLKWVFILILCHFCVCVSCCSLTEHKSLEGLTSFEDLTSVTAAFTSSFSLTSYMMFFDPLFSFIDDYISFILLYTWQCSGESDPSIVTLEVDSSSCFLSTPCTSYFDLWIVKNWTVLLSRLPQHQLMTLSQHSIPSLIDCLYK